MQSKVHVGLSAGGEDTQSEQGIVLSGWLASDIVR